MVNQVAREMAELAGEQEDPVPSRRARLVRAQVQFDVVLDDGGPLVPVPIQPITVSEQEWPPNLEQLLKNVEEQVAQSQG